MLEEVAAVFTEEEVNRMAGHANFLLVVLTKGLLHDSSFAEVLLGMSERRKRPHMFPINADLSFDFPSTEFYSAIEEHDLPPAFEPDARHVQELPRTAASALLDPDRNGKVDSDEFAKGCMSPRCEAKAVCIT